jgi:O-antigen/teichoic acid export membrane protein
MQSTIKRDHREPILVAPVGSLAVDPERLSLQASQGVSLALLTRSSAIAMAGGLISQGLKFLVVIYVARRFSPTEFGWFSFAVAVNAYITVASSFGLPVFGSRAIARSRTISRGLLQEIVCIRLFLALASVATSLAILWFAPSVSRVELSLVALFGLSNIPLAAFFDWTFQGLHRQEVSASLNIVWQAGWLAFTAIGISLGMGIVAVAIALAASALVASVVGYIWLRWSATLVSRTNSYASLPRRFWQVLRCAAPLGWGTMLISVLVWSDAICVRLIRGDVAVGIYAAGNRVAMALSMLATFYVQGAFPVLSRASEQGSSSFARCFTQTFVDLAILFVPGAAWAICYAREIIDLIFRRSDYVTAVPVFRIFQIVLLLFVMNTLLGTGVLVAFHRDEIFRKVLFTTALVFLVLCPLLTWVAGSTGAAGAVLLSQTLSLLWFVRETQMLVRLRLRRALGAPVLCSIVSVAVCLVFHLSLRVGVIPLAGAYLALVTLRFFNVEGEPSFG